jgi:hypothetical protein
MSRFGSEGYRPPRWLALVVVASVIGGIAFAAWMFGALT